jgi:transposase
VEFRTIVEEFQREMQGPHTPLWIHDSAGYNKKWLEDQKSDGDSFFPWLTRIPESIKKAKDLVMASYHENDWEQIGNGYRAIEFQKIYGGIKQLWILYHSDQAHSREIKTIANNVAKEHDQITKALWHLSNKEFGCESDAQNAFTQELAQARYHEVDSFELISENKHKNSGRPKTGATPKVIVYKIKGIFREKAIDLAKIRESCGRFILGTNHVGLKALQDPLKLNIPDADVTLFPSNDLAPIEPIVASRAQQMLSMYKELQGTENAFKMLKNKEFMMNRFFLHKESRIEALLVLFALAIFVHNYMQHVIVAALDKANIKLRGPGGAVLLTNTLHRVFEIFRTVTALRQGNTKVLYQIQKLKPQQIEILRALSPPYRWKYGVKV